MRTVGPLVPEPLLEEPRHVERGDAEHRVGVGALHPQHLVLAGSLDARQVVEQRAARLHEAHGLRARGLGGVDRDLAAGGQDLLHATPRHGDHARQVVRQPASQPRVAVRTQRLGEEAPGVVDAGRQAIVGDDAAGAAGQVDEASARELDAAGGRHDVLELVGLVDHRELVVGEQQAVHGQVEPVEVEVHHDDVGILGALAGRLREARSAARAARRSGALLGGHAQPRSTRARRAPRRARRDRRSRWSRPSRPASTAPRPAPARPRRRGPAVLRPCRSSRSHRGAACTGSSIAP